EAQLLCTHRQQGSHLPARVAPGRLDLDNVSAKVAQNAAHVGSKWFGNIQHTNPVESPAGLVTLGDFHVPSIEARGRTLAIDQSCGFSLRRASPSTCSVCIVAYRGPLVILTCGVQCGHV